MCSINPLPEQKAATPLPDDAKRMVWCHYAMRLIELGRSRTRCPNCRAEIGNSGHNVSVVERRRRV